MILEFMRDDHRSCDCLYADCESALLAKEVEKGRDLFSRFSETTLHHFDMEERELFITFEKRTGMMGGPTQMMRYEHQQLRSLLESMKLALNENRFNDFFGIGESMMIMLQQHNMKEEQMLYPMIDRALGSDAQLMVQTLKAMDQ
ncbi:MAG: hemerythrin domain-containing protein [Sulfuricurvum sp.]|jgi:hemerythrin-like domain-containing protein|uniref:hemerythrin domain-containing protein n=1 Tax=Sulfuricurvum sp. TaxID=2025608 RepID=UPI0025F7D7D6|nr:hemerythrin domain-containing protein [Sulfuricurvum sp.]MCK9371915.1 hemerythrin domain-containing protein [Sulfuricurvum sp.]